MALILLYDKRYARTALYDRLQPYHNYAKNLSFYSIFQREPLKIEDVHENVSFNKGNIIIISKPH